jgi:preprotein translocase subunit SecD
MSLVALLHTASIRSEAANKRGAFGIFEVVDCPKTGAKPMKLKRGEHEEKYCLAAKPIVNQTQLRAAKSESDDVGRPMLELELTQEGAQTMRKITQRIMSEHAVRGDQGSLALVVKGKLLTTASLMNVIEGQLALTLGSSFSREEVDELAGFLMGREKAPPPGLRKT